MTATPVARLGVGVSAASVWTLRILVLVAGVALLGWGLGLIWSITLPVLLALLLSTVLRPPARLLSRVVPDGVAALVTVVGLLALGVAVVRLLAPQVRDQSRELVEQTTVNLERFQQGLVDGPIDTESELFATLVDQAIDRVQQDGAQIATAVANGVINGAIGVGSAVVTAVLALVFTFFLVKDAQRFLPWAERWVGPRASRHVAGLGGRLWTTLGGFIWSQAAVSLVDAVFIGLGLWLLDVPFALTLSVLIFVAGFVPIVGAVVTGLLAVLVALLSEGPGTAVAVLVLVVLVQQLESNVLQPVLVGRVLALHPAVVLGAVTAGATLAGIVGAFLAVPLVSVVAVSMRYVREQLTEDAETTAARGATG